MKKYKTEFDDKQLLAFQHLLEKCLTIWEFEDSERIYKYALWECLKTVRQKLAEPVFKKCYKLQFSSVQSLAIYWLWQELPVEKAPSDLYIKLQMDAYKIDQQTTSINFQLTN